MIGVQPLVLDTEGSTIVKECTAAEKMVARSVGWDHVGQRSSARRSVERHIGAVVS